VFLGAASIQVMAAMSASSSRTITNGGIHDVAELVMRFGERVVGGVLAWPAVPGAAVMPPLVGLGLFIVMGAWIFRCCRLRVAHARMAAVLYAYAVAVFLVPAWVTGAPSRYSYASDLMLLASLAVLIRVRDRVLLAGIGLVALLWSTSFSASEYRVNGPSWSAGVAAARHECLHATGAELRIGPFRPDGDPWKTTRYPCSSL
jgi:hypothetical protein